MSKKEVIKNYHKYHIPGCAHHKTLKKNAIFISTTNTIKHELAKCIGGIMLKRWGDISFSETVKGLINLLDKQIAKEFQEWPEEGSDFLTES